MKAFRILDAATNVAQAKGARTALSRIENTQSASGYAEPGYDLHGKDCVLFNNWNKLDKWNQASGTHVTIEPDNTIWSRTIKLLEKVAELEWSDEWTTCSDCGKAVRTQGDSYGWQRSYWESPDYDIVCVECVKNCADEVLESFEGRDNGALTRSLKIDPAEHGYWLAQDKFENGWHGGQDADPKTIAKTLRSNGIERFLFRIDYVNQFDLSFSLFIHESEKAKWESKLEGELSHPEYKAAEDPAEALKRGLQSAAMAPRPQGEGVVVTKIHGDGTSSTKLISPEDFVAGKAID